MAYIALCLMIPLVWGITVAWFLNARDRKRRAAEASKSGSADMYEI